jgi:hypothetical protein
MSKINPVRDYAGTTQLMNAGKPSMPLIGKQPVSERKTSDPSSASPKGERYPIPSFFEYRIKHKEYDPL